MTEQEPQHPDADLEPLRRSERAVEEAKEAAREATADMPGLQDAPATETGQQEAAREQPDDAGPPA